MRVKACYFVVGFSQLSFSVEVQIIMQKVIHGEGIGNVAPRRFDPSCGFCLWKHTNDMKDFIQLNSRA